VLVARLLFNHAALQKLARQSFVARLESTAADAKVSTVDRYAASLGYVVQYHLIPADENGLAAPVVVVH
jgi:hypothetical protein